MIDMQNDSVAKFDKRMCPMRRNALAVALYLGIGFTSFAQDAIPRSQRSILQPEEEAAAQPAKFDETKYLTDNWGGYREHLRNAGVEVFGFYNNIVSGNAVGGRDEGHATYDHDIWIGAKFDLEKLAGWKDGQFVISGINRDGEDLTTKYIGSIFSTQQLVGGQRTFLYQVFLQQKFVGDKLTLKIGRFGASDDFNTSPLYGYSLNNGIDGDIRNVLAAATNTKNRTPLEFADWGFDMLKYDWCSYGDVVKEDKSLAAPLPKTLPSHGRTLHSSKNATSSESLPIRHGRRLGVGRESRRP